MKRFGHRSHVGGTRRLLGNRKRRSQIQDYLRERVARMFRVLQRQQREANDAK